MPTPRRSQKQLENLLASPSSSLANKDLWTEPVCLRLLQHIDQVVLDTPVNARYLAVLAVRIAIRTVRRRRYRGIRERRVFARALAVLGSVHRVLGRLSRAASLLEKAEEVARSEQDKDTLSEVLRRKAALQISVAQEPNGHFDDSILECGLYISQEAVEAARDPFLEGRARVIRGTLFAYRGRGSEAFEESKKAVRLIDGKKWPYDYAAVLSVIVHALTQGSPMQRQRGLVYLRWLKKDLPSRSPALRARVNWAEARLLLASKAQKGRAKRLLDQALRVFLRLKMQSEAIALTAEIANLDPSGPIPEYCDRLLPILEDSKMRRHFESLRSAALIERLPLLDMLMESVPRSVFLATGS